MPSWWLRGLAGVLVALLLVTAGVVAVRADGPDRFEQALAPWRGQDEDVSVRHREVAAAAKDLAVAFLSVDHTDMDALVEKVLAGATGEFAAAYAADRDRLVREAQRARSLSVAEVVAVGVAELGEESATVLVAADTVVRNRTTGDRAEARYYRLRIEMVREDGRWLARGVEFVR